MKDFFQKILDAEQDHNCSIMNTFNFDQPKGIHTDIPFLLHNEQFSIFVFMKSEF